MHLKRVLSWFSFQDINNLDVRMNETWPEHYRLNRKLYSKMDLIIFPTLKFAHPMMMMMMWKKVDLWPLRHDWLEAQVWGSVQKKSAAFRVPMSTAVSIVQMKRTNEDSRWSSSSGFKVPDWGLNSLQMPDVMFGGKQAKHPTPSPQWSQWWQHHPVGMDFSEVVLVFTLRAMLRYPWASSKPPNDHVGPWMSWGGRAFTQL